MNLPGWQVVTVPTIGGLLIGLFVYYFMPGKRGRGVADVMESVALRSGAISLRAGLGAGWRRSAASIGVGASVGREGPVVHLGATLSSFVATKLRLSRSQAVTLLGCGWPLRSQPRSTPIAGVFFALEAWIGHYALSAFAPIVIAGVIGTIISRVYFGDFPAFIVPDQSLVSFWEFPLSALLGVVRA